MAIALRGTATKTHVAIAATSWVLTVPTGVVAGDVVLFVTYTGNNHTISGYPSGAHATKALTSFEDTGDTTWDADGDPTGRIFAWTAPSSPPSTVTVTMAAAVSGDAYAVAFSGANTSDAIARFKDLNHGSGDGASTICDAVTTTIDGEYVVRGALLASTNALTVPSGAATSATSTAGDAPSSAIAAMGVKTPAGDTGQATFGNSSGFGTGWTATIKPAGGNASPTVDAGADETIDPNLVDTLTLTATASDSDGTIASYLWEDITGTPATVTGSGATRTVNVPRSTAGETRTYRVTVTDNGGATATDTVVKTILPHTRWLKTAGGLVPLRRYVP